MALERQPLSISLAQGVDTKTDPKQVVAGKLIALKNAVFKTAKSLRQRWGYEELPNDVFPSGNIDSTMGLATFKDQLVLAAVDGVYSYAPNKRKWLGPLGNFQPLSLSVASAYHPSGSLSSHDAVYHQSGLKASVFQVGGGGITYTITDSVTGAVFVAGQSIATGSRLPKVLAFGDYFVFTYLDGLNVLKCYAVPVASPTSTPAPVTLASDVGSTSRQNYDVTVINTRLFIVYNNNASGISLKYLDTALTLSAATVVSSQRADTCAIFGDTADNVWVAFFDGSALAVKGFAYNYDLTSQVVSIKTIESSVTNVDNITGLFVSDLTSVVYYEIFATAAYDYRIRLNFFGSTGAGTASDLVRSLALASKAFRYGSSNYFFAIYQSDIQPTFFLVNATTFQIAAKIAPGVAGVQAFSAMLAEVSQLPSGAVETALLQTDRILTTFTRFYGGITAQVLFGHFGGTVELGNALHLGGGYLAMYDGVSVVEHGFHVFPEKPTATQTSTGGVLPDGTYSYVACYEWTDNAGQNHRSAPSPSVSVTVASGTSTNKITLNVPTLRITDKQGTRPSVRIVVFRTKANGSIYFRASLTNLFNDPSVDTVSFVDSGAPDSSIEGYPQLYTTGGEVDNIATPAVLAMTSYKNRMIVIPADNPYSWWYSKEIIQGTASAGANSAPVEFSDLFVENVEQRGGPLTAAAQMDDKLILFKRRNILFLVGNGPAPSGSGNDFSPAQMLPVDSGCVDAASVVLTPDGLMYKSEKGIYLLDRTLQATYIGADVEAYNSASVTSAVLVPDTTEVRFTLSTRVTLVYDYLFREWSVFEGVYGAGATVFQGRYCYATPGGRVLQETPGSYADPIAPVTVSLKMSWLQFAGLQGFQRVYRALLLADNAAAHTITVNVSHDFESAITQTQVISPAPATTYQYRIDFWRQKCEALQLEIICADGSGAGGIVLSAIGLEVGVKKGLNKMSQARTHS